MDMFSKKPSNQDSPVDRVKDSVDTGPSEPVTKTTSTVQPVVQKEKHSRAFSFVSVLFLLTLLAAGILAYLWYNQKADYDSLNTDLGSAETTISGLRTQLGKLNKENNTLEDTVVDQVASAGDTSDGEQIKKLVLANEHARVAAATTTFKVGEPTIQGAFAKASVSDPDGSGWRCVLKKVDGIWVILYCGQSTPSQADLDKWGVPKDF